MSVRNSPEFATMLAARLAEAGTPLEYVMPHPGLKGADRVREDCHCNGGWYAGPSRVTFNAETSHGIRGGKLCFHCNGEGTNSIRVSSVRARERRHVNLHNADVSVWIASAASVVENELNARQRANEAAARAAHALAEAEQALETLPEAGTVLENVDCTVAKFVTFEAAGYAYGSGIETKAVVKLVDAQGRIYTWITGSTKAWDFQDEGTPVRITKARVKRSSIYRNEAQIELTRPTLKAAVAA